MDIETFLNPEPGRHYIIQHIAEEFTSVCPKTGHPDFATVVLTYAPGEVCVELKAYKLYLQGFRTRGAFYEQVTNLIFDQLWGTMNPRWMRIETIWSGRGGIRSILTAENAQPAYDGPIYPYFG